MQGEGAPSSRPERSRAVASKRPQGFFKRNRIRIPHGGYVTEIDVVVATRERWARSAEAAQRDRWVVSDPGSADGVVFAYTVMAC